MSSFFGGRASQSQQQHPNQPNQNQLQPYAPGGQQVYPSLPGQPGQQLHYQGSSGQLYQNQGYNQLQPSQNAGPSYNNQQQGQIGYNGQSYPGSQVTGYQYNPYVGQPIPPQPLDEIPTNESDKFGALTRAGNKIARALESDVEISPDLMAKQQPPSDALYVPTPSPAFLPARKGRHLPLPDALHQELNYKHLTAKMGLFEAIGRAWFTIDNKLFLWDYSDGRDFSRYDEQADTITAVGLVPARRDVFIDALTHLLIICTSTKITVLGLGIENGTKNISLFSTNLTTSISTPITYIAGSTTGKVFMLGESKELFELEYSNDSSWFFGSGARTAVKNLSAGYLSNLLPTFLTSGTREGVETFVVDSERNYLFTLRTQSEIEVFSFGNDRFEQVAKYVQPRNQPKIVSIAVIGKHESQTKSLVAITATGVRYFFSVYPGRMSTEYMQFTRNPPSSDLQLTPLSTYSSGTTIAVQADSTQGSQASRLHIFTPQIGFVSSKRDNERQKVNPLLQEQYTVQDLSAEVWAIAEVSATNPSNTPSAYRVSATYGGANVIALDPLALSAISEQRELLVLTSVGLDHIILPRPIDLLQDAVATTGDGYDKAVQQYGRTQVTAMGIAFGSTIDLNQTDNYNFIGTIILNGGEPFIDSATNSVSKGIRFSSKHDGLALTLSRYLRPIWTSPICVSASPSPQGPLALAVPVNRLKSVAERLRKLKKFNDEVQYPLGRGEGDKKLAWDHEEMSLQSLYKLTEHTLEAIAFIILLQDFGLPAKVSAIPQLRQEFASLTYERLLTKADGQVVANKLVQFLIETQLGTEGGVDSLTTRLQADCGAFCQPGDVVRYKAEESLRRAEREPNPSERRAYLDEALRMFNQSGSRADKDVGDNVKRIAARFREQQYVPGAVEFPLNTARSVDPEDHAVAWEAAGSPQGDWRRQIWEQRQICYGFAIEALQEFDAKWNQAIAANAPGASNAALDSAAAKRDEAYRIAIDSNDELFHFRLYDWIIKSHRPEQFLDFDTEFVETYLQRTNSDEPEHRDLLWKYYQRKEEYMKAAHALVDLATRESQLELEQRSFYLAQALSSARSAERISAEDVDFVNMVQERMDVSHVQLEVVQAIREHPDLTNEEKMEVLSGLNTRLVPLDSLFQDFARPYRLFEQILLILKTADTRLDDVLEAVWTHLLQNARGTPQWSAIRDVVIDLCRKYFPSEAAPLDIVIHTVYQSALPLASMSGQGWATEALLDGGIPIRECFEELAAFTESAETEEERQFYVEEAATIAERWSDDRDAIPLADVEKYVTQQLLRLGAGDLDERQLKTKERLTRAKNAIRRW